MFILMPQKSLIFRRILYVIKHRRNVFIYFSFVMDQPSLKPEELARQKIDEMLRRAGWDIVKRDEYSERFNACALEEALLVGNKEADYLLTLDGKAIGVLEAKRKESSLGNKVSDQVASYSAKVPNWTQAWMDPLPFLFKSNGEDLLFCDQRNIPDGEEAEFISLKKMYTPKELANLANLQSEFAKMPAVPAVGPKGLRQCQYDAISNLELNFKRGKKKALIILATGSGKTFTACTAAYRLLNYTPARKVLFLVDRNNLGKQAEGEFGTYKLTQTGKPFIDEYGVVRLRSVDEIKSDANNVVICTIQRLFATLTGQAYEDSDDDESDLDSSTDQASGNIDLPDDLKLAKDTFDLIIVDECHRSIYGKWQQVLKYFNTARIVGLTATPTEEAFAFFDKNTVVKYDLDDSIRDGVNVPARVYRIKTAVSDEGGVIKSGEKYQKKLNADGSTQKKTQKDEQEYSNTDLDRSIVNPAQIRLVVEQYKESIYSSLFPERKKGDISDLTSLPKTLFFAKTDSHADNIIDEIEKVFKAEFAKYGEEIPKSFVQKITCKAGNADKKINSFRNDKDFRIAVTVTLVATGTDVKPLEILVFMRDINSAVLYTQMKGRGCRTIDDEKLKLVTPNAPSKDCFFLVDAVGVTEHEMVMPTGGDGPQDHKVLSLAKLMERLAHGDVCDANLDLFAGYLSKIQNKADEDDLVELNKLMAPEALYIFIKRIQDALGGKNEFADTPLPDFIDISQPNNERKVLISAIIDNSKARVKVNEINKGFIKILDEGTDTVVYAGLSVDESGKYTEIFEKYIEEHKDEIEALRIIYNSEDVAITYEMLLDLKNKLHKFDPMLTTKNLWGYYNTLSNNGKLGSRKVKKLEDSEVELLTDLIQLVRFAFQKEDTLYSLQGTSAQRFELYCGQNQRTLTADQKAILKKIAQFVIQNGCISNITLAKYNKQLLMQVAPIWGPENFNSEIQKLSKFLFQ